MTVDELIAESQALPADVRKLPVEARDWRGVFRDAFKPGVRHYELSGELVLAIEGGANG